MDRIVSRWTETFTRDELVALLRDNGVPVGPVNNVEDILNDPHAKAREMIIDKTDKDGRNWRMEGVFPKLSRTPGSVENLGGELGSDNERIFGALGLGAEDMAELKKDNII